MLFEPKIIEGVDIDPHLIKKAQNYLIFRNSLVKSQDIKENEEQNIKNENELLFDYYPISCPLTIGSIPIILNNQDSEKKLKNEKELIENKSNELDMDVDDKNNENLKENNTNSFKVKNDEKKELKEMSMENDNSNENLLIEASRFPNNVYFRVSDWVNEPTIEEHKNSYDIILGYIKIIYKYFLLFRSIIIKGN